MTRTKREVRSIQTWPGGQVFTYRGDPDGPANTRSLRVTSYNGEPQKPWRKGTADEWRTIKIALRAEIYADRDILCCDSSLVDDLIKAAGCGDPRNGDLAEAFSYDEIRNLYRDPSDWDATQCREYAEEQGVELPSGVRHTSCQHCEDDIEGYIDGSGDGRWLDRGGNWHCNANEESGIAEGEQDHEPTLTDQESDEEEWLTEARDACRDHAQDNPAEPYEWWRVSSWLCDQLHAIGEVTIDNGYGHWWGRTCTGQGLIMDGTLQQIAARFD